MKQRRDMEQQVARVPSEKALLTDSKRARGTRNLQATLQIALTWVR